MSPTNGRGHILEAVMVWPWDRCGAMQYLVRSLPAPDFVAVVPPMVDRPSWIPAHATAHPLAGDETAFTWRAPDVR